VITTAVAFTSALIRKGFMRVSFCFWAVLTANRTRHFVNVLGLNPFDFQISSCAGSSAAAGVSAAAAAAAAALRAAVTAEVAGRTVR
jgi:hypothetical protein